MAAGPKDLWDKLGIVLSPVGGLLTALAVAFVGFYGSHMIEKRQTAETNARLYSELMSKREESESGLRKDMLLAVMQSFLQPDGSALDSRILKLELLAYNFHESLDLKPLFTDLARRVQHVDDPAQKKELQRRMNDVAKDIANRQLFALEGRGRSFRRSVDLEELAAKGKSGLALDPETITLDGQVYTVSLRVLGVDPDAQELRMRIEVKPPAEVKNLVVTRRPFSVSFYDFPLIDNTRLSNGQRCAVLLGAFSREAAAAELTTICYPGEYASVKDRPYYDEVIQQLRQADKSSGVFP
jgi:hypothetical protein